MAWIKGKKRSNGNEISISSEHVQMFFNIWSKDEINKLASLSRRAQGNWLFRLGFVPMLFFLWLWAIHGRKLTFESALIQTWPKLFKLFGNTKEIVSEQPITASALAQARESLGVEVFEGMLSVANKKILQRFDKMTRWKGLRLVAVDGSWLNLPARKSLMNHFGFRSNKMGNSHYPQALLVTLDYIRLGYFFDYRLAPCNASEFGLAKDLTKQLVKGDLLLGDRLYFDTEWYKDFSEQDILYLMRVCNNRYQSLIDEDRQKVERLRMKGKVIDIQVTLKVNANNRGRKKSLLPIRYIEMPPNSVGNNELLCFLTTLDKSIADTYEALSIYKERWGQETDYRIFKGENHLPVVNSRKVKTVHQEILIRILAHNSVRFVQAEACELARKNEIKSSNKKNEKIKCMQKS